MRQVLILALCVLPLVLLANWVGRASREAQPELSSLETGRRVIAVSKGPLLPAATIGAGEERLDDAILIDDHHLSFPGARGGLRLAVLPPDRDVAQQGVLDIGSSRQARLELARICREQAPGSILVATYAAPGGGSIDPHGELEPVLAELGSLARPFGPRRSSWVLICFRRPTGWVNLGEAYSEEIGVALTRSIPADGAVLDDHEPRLWLPRAGADDAIDLSQEVRHAARRSERTGRTRARVRDHTVPAIYAPVIWDPQGDSHSTLRWDDIPLGQGARLRADLGMYELGREESDGALFRILVDDREVGSWELSEREARHGSWKEVELPLDAYAGRSVDLELRVEPAGSVEGDVALWGQPLLYAGVPGGREDANARKNHVIAASLREIVRKESTDGAAVDPGPAVPLTSGPILSSPFNGKSLQTGYHGEPYSFLVGGHLYGSPSNRSSIFPSSSLLANLGRINGSDALFFAGLGDVIRYTTDRHIRAFQLSFASQLRMPFYNAVGNHDVGAPAYVKSFGKETTFGFQYGRSLFLFLDTERDVGRISGVQLDRLHKTIEHVRGRDAFQHLFIFSHKLLWAPARPELEIVYRFVNNRDGYKEDGEFGQQVLGKLRELAEEKEVYWFSGDVGCDFSLQLFHHREPGTKLHWVATGIGDTEDDALLRVSVDGANRVDIEVMRLDGKPSRPLGDFGLEYWRNHFRGR